VKTQYFFVECAKTAFIYAGFGGTKQPVTA